MCKIEKSEYPERVKIYAYKTGDTSSFSLCVTTTDLDAKEGVEYSKVSDELPEKLWVMEGDKVWLTSKEGSIEYRKFREGERDWTEDFSHENGNYLNICIECNQQFIGHKRRVICKLCSDKVGEAIMFKNFCVQQWANHPHISTEISDEKVVRWLAMKIFETYELHRREGK